MVKVWEYSLGVEEWSSSYSSVDCFLKHYGRKTRSEQTRKYALLVLSQFCRFTSVTPDVLVTLSPEEVSERLQAFLDERREADLSIKYLNVMLAYLTVFFRVNGFKNGRELEVERYHQPARYRKTREYIPLREEINRMTYAAGSKMERAILLVAYTSGLRNSTLRALRYKDVREELENGLNVVKLRVYPAMKEVDPGACKGNIPYFTFISREAVTALKDYLDERSIQYGGIKDDEPLFCSTSTNYPAELRRTTPIKTQTLQVLVKRAARKAGIDDWKWVTPHTLRKAFESTLRNGGLDVKDQEFLMGHVLPEAQDAYYDRSEIEELRTKYAKVRFFKTGEIDKAKIIKSIKSFAKSLGIENIEIKIAKLRKAEPNLLEEEAIGKIVRDELIKPMKIKSSKELGNDPKKVIEENQLEHYLADGWDVQTILPSGKIIVRRD